MEIVVIGMGYVGIPTAAILAGVENFNVIGVQRRTKRSGWKIDFLNMGKSPIQGEEPGLDELIQKVVKNGKFRVTDDISVCSKADIILIDVQTPINKDHEPEYGALKELIRTIGMIMKKGVMIIIESTLAPGTTKYIIKPILEESSKMKVGKDFNLVFSYERVMVGRLLNNILYMPRIVGGLTAECKRRGIEFYRNFVKAELFSTDCITAETAKVVENTYRDVNIAFANEVALLCESLGVNVHEVRRFVNSLPNDPSDPQKNPFRMMHIPGAGVGGHCLPKDPWLLKYGNDAFGEIRFKPKILIGSRMINDSMPQHMKDLIKDALKEKGLKMKDTRVCILGLAFIENSDDTRNSPSLSLYKILNGICKEVEVHDPYVKGYEGMVLKENLEDVLKGKDCIAIVTRHKEYVKINLNWLKSLMNTPIIVDGRNTFNPEDCYRLGFTYRGVGIGIKRREENE